MNGSLLLISAVQVAVGVDALAGAGSFVALPPLIERGVPSLSANVMGTVAVLYLVLAGAVEWNAALLPGAGAVAGGSAEVHLDRRIEAAIVRLATIMFSAAVATVSFIHA